MPVSTLHRLAVVSCVLSGLALSPGGRQALAQESAIGLSIDQVTQRVLAGNPELQAAALARDAARSSTEIGRAHV